MPNGWEKLGASLAGISDSNREDIRTKTMNALAQRDYNVERAKGAIMKQRELERLGESLAGIDGITNPEAYAGVARSGVNLNQVLGAAAKQQQMGFRQAAVDAPTFGDANRQLMGVASGPQAVAAIQGNTTLGNRFVEGGDVRGPTALGQSMIDRNADTGQAALIRANRPPASRSSGGGAGGPTKADLDRIRIESSTAEAELKAAANDLASERVRRDPTKAAEAQARADKATQKLLEIRSKYGVGGGQSGPQLSEALIPANGNYTLDASLPPQLQEEAIRINGGRQPSTIIQPGFQPFEEQFPEAQMHKLKEGEVTTFGNGQRWMLKGGKPVRVG